MNFRRKTLLIILITLLISCISSASEVYISIKQKLKQYSLIELQEINQRRKTFNPSAMYTRMTEEEQRKLQQQRYDAIEKRIKQLQAFIDKTPEEQLPDALFSRFLNDDKALYEYPKLSVYILSIDNLIMLPIMNRYYSQSDSVKRFKILKLLEHLEYKESRKALPLVKNALDDPDQDVRSQAQKILVAIWQLRKKPELINMLIATKDIWSLKPTARDYALIGNKKWYEKFFTLVKNKKAFFYDLNSIGDIQDSPEEVIGDNLNFLINIITANNPSSSFFHKDSSLILKKSDDRYLQKTVHIIQKFLLRIKHPKYIKELYPLLRTLLHDRYWGGRTAIGTSAFRKPPKPYNRLRFKDYESDKLIKIITSTLQPKDVEKWQSKIPVDFLTDSFLEFLFAQKTGNNLPPYDKNIRLRITVINRNNNETFAMTEYLFDPNKKTSIVLPSKNEFYPDRNLTINVHLDREQWMYLASITIDFKPYGVGFDTYIPMAGINEISFTSPDTKPGIKYRTIWIIEHIYQLN